MGNIESADERPSESVTAHVAMSDEYNGLHLFGHYIPEEVFVIILSHVESATLLQCNLVCKLWNRLVTSHTLWNEIHLRKFNRPAKALPWWMLYMKANNIFFDKNLITNGNGAQKFDNWVIKPVFSGDGFFVESEPQGAMALPEHVDEFNGCKSCFATSFGMCSKHQILSLKNHPAYNVILNQYKPTIVASDWYAPRFDCSCMYQLIIRVGTKNKKFKDYCEQRTEPQWTEGVWKKVTVEISDYEDDIDYIVFQHEGHDMLFWKGHYGAKMAGASLKFSYDSIKV